jgi:hypothetical protein
MRLVGHKGNWVNLDLGCGLAALSPLLPHQGVTALLLLQQSTALLLLQQGAIAVATEHDSSAARPSTALVVHRVRL